MAGPLARTGAAIALVTVLLATSARADDEDDGPSCNDLLVWNPCHPGGKVGHGQGWARWWFANRTAILKPSYRVGSLGQGTLPGVRARARITLNDALKSKNVLIASEAALALGRLGDERDVAALVQIVEDPDVQSTRRQHRYAALALGMIDIKDAETAVRARNALLGGVEAATGERDKFAFFEANCAYALAMRMDRAALPKLLDIRRAALAAVDSRNAIHASVLGPMIYAMAALGDQDVLPEVTEHLGGKRGRGAGSIDTSWCAAHALSRISGPKAKQLLREAAQDERRDVRLVALGALGTASDNADGETEKLLREKLAVDDDPVCRQMAAISLGRAMPTAAEAVLMKRWSSAPAVDRASIAIGLGLSARATSSPQVRDFLAKALDDANDLDETVALSIACGIAGAKAAQSRLVSLADGSHSEDITAYACYGLGFLSATPDALKVLHATVDRAGDYVPRREAVLALGLLRDSSVVKQLQVFASAEQNSDIDRAAAVVALGRVGDDTSVDFLLELLADKSASNQLRACVIHGLGLLLDRSGDDALPRIAADNMWFGLTRGVAFQPIYDIDHLVD